MATLALIISIIALVLALLAYYRVGGVADLKKQTEVLSNVGDAIAKATDSLRDKTADILDRMEAKDLGVVISDRRSVRKYSADPLTKGEFAAIVASLGIPYDADWLRSPTNPHGIGYFEQNDVFIAVNNVEGMDQGLYVCDWEFAGLE